MTKTCLRTILTIEIRRSPLRSPWIKIFLTNKQVLKKTPSPAITKQSWSEPSHLGRWQPQWSSRCGYNMFFSAVECRNGGIKQGMMDLAIFLDSSWEYTSHTGDTIEISMGYMTNFYIWYGLCVALILYILIYFMVFHAGSWGAVSNNHMKEHEHICTTGVVLSGKGLVRGVCCNFLMFSWAQQTQKGEIKFSHWGSDKSRSLNKPKVSHNSSGPWHWKKNPSHREHCACILYVYYMHLTQ